MVNMSKKARVQELYRHLDHYSEGNKHMAWYGQLRAEGMEHDEALEATIVHFHLREQEWYQNRQKP